jgi:hypothetical protein
MRDISRENINVFEKYSGEWKELSTSPFDKSRLKLKSLKNLLQYLEKINKFQFNIRVNLKLNHQAWTSMKYREFKFIIIIEFNKKAVSLFVATSEFYYFIYTEFLNFTFSNYTCT